MLKVIEGAGLTDGIVVCIRWFGGTKLGTGGLVRAYTEAAQGALASAEAQNLLESIRILRHGCFQVRPEDAHLPFAALGSFPEAEITGREFAAEGLKVRFSIPPEQAGDLESAWRERSRGGAVDWDG
jgi:putative IMPACT (imprinted ancient) family translation regulator